MRNLLLIIIVVLHIPWANAETGLEAWLRYAPLSDVARAKYASLPACVVVSGNSAVLANARQEIIIGVRGMLGRTLRIEKELPKESAIIIGTTTSLKSTAPALTPPKIGKEGFWLAKTNIAGIQHLVIASLGDRGVLYGVFAFLGKIAREQDMAALDEVQQPYAPVSWVDQWDNLNGTIERGYGGPSIFFNNDNVRGDLTPVSKYGRILSSIGIHGCNIKNSMRIPVLSKMNFCPS
jgi:alpha-glucuronidase